MVYWKAVNKGTIHLFGNRKATTIHSIKCTIESIPQVTASEHRSHEKFSCILFAHSLAPNPLHHFIHIFSIARVLLLWIPIPIFYSLCVSFAYALDENGFANITPTELKRIICLFSADCLWLGAQTTRNSDFVHINRTSAGKTKEHNTAQSNNNNRKTVSTPLTPTTISLWCVVQCENKTRDGKRNETKRISEACFCEINRDWNSSDIKIKTKTNQK